MAVMLVHQHVATAGHLARSWDLFDTLFALIVLGVHSTMPAHTYLTAHV